MGEGEDGGARSGRLSLVKAHQCVSVVSGVEEAGGRRRKGEGLTEHLATSSKVRAPWVADRLEEDAILLAAHILCSKNGGRQCGGCWRPCARR